jgi:hypothetical protein
MAVRLGASESRCLRDRKAQSKKKKLKRSMDDTVDNRFTVALANNNINTQKAAGQSIKILVFEKIYSTRLAHKPNERPACMHPRSPDFNNYLA